jgi:hypothetical protein
MSVIDLDLSEVDPFDLEWRQDPWPLYRRFQDESPVHRDPLGGWLVTRWDDCDRVLRDRRFGSDPSKLNEAGHAAVGSNDVYQPGTSVLLFIDPPDHTRFRSLVLFDEADLVDLWCRETLPETGDEFARGITRLARTYEDAIRVGVAEGRINCADPRTTALLLVYAVEGTANHAIINRAGPAPDELIAAAQTMTHRVLGLSEPPHQPRRRRRNSAT